MPEIRAHLFSARDVPETHRPVVAARETDALVRREGEGHDRLLVSEEISALASESEVPRADERVRSAGKRHRSVFGDGERPDRIRLSLEDAHGVVAQAPDAQGSIVAAGEHARAGKERDRRDDIAMSFENSRGLR